MAGAQRKVLLTRCRCLRAGRPVVPNGLRPARKPPNDPRAGQNVFQLLAESR